MSFDIFDEDATLKSDFENNHKRLEWASKHYHDLFTYHAGQRLTAFNFFVVSLSFFSNAYATLLSKDTADNNLRLVAAALAAAAYLLVIAFGRLDKRNEQIIHIGEGPIKRIQSLIDAHYGDKGHWTTFVRMDKEFSLLTFGSLLPKIYFLAALMMTFGVAYALVSAKQISFCAISAPLVIACIFAWVAINYPKIPKK